MTSSEFTKRERAELRELAGAVYEAEARGYLEELDEDFAKWRKGKILSSDLLTSIHYFHQHQNRELWSTYQGLSDDMVVERGLGLGLLSEAKVPAKLLEKIRKRSAANQ
jgi:hypothetical protein